MKQFSKAERLCSKKTIEALFSKHNPEAISLFSFPLRVVALKKIGLENTLPAVLMSVSKRNFKRATDRNRIKRLLREAYRTQKYLLADSPDLAYIAFVYVGKEILPYEHIAKKLRFVLEQLARN